MQINVFYRTGPTKEVKIDLPDHGNKGWHGSRGARQSSEYCSGKVRVEHLTATVTQPWYRCASLIYTAAVCIRLIYKPKYSTQITGKSNTA